MVHEMYLLKKSAVSWFKKYTFWEKVPFHGSRNAPFGKKCRSLVQEMHLWEKSAVSWFKKCTFWKKVPFLGSRNVPFGKVPFLGS
ncbi:MAG: hypothetical protein LBV26_01105 [Bacteroidales bacterium]|jgi:hypothetical protein|nr:hypothetical protein [Bacteroidales bacterium]